MNKITVELAEQPEAAIARLLANKLGLPVAIHLPDCYTIIIADSMTTEDLIVLSYTVEDILIDFGVDFHEITIN